MKLWEAIKRWTGIATGAGKPPAAPVRSRVSSAERWDGLLKTLRLSPSKLMEHLGRELAAGLSDPERRLALPREGQFFDGLIIGRKVSELDALGSRLDSASLRARLSSKCPTLAQWAKGESGEAGVLASICPEIVAWARQGGHFQPNELRESHLAEAIESGQERLTRSVMAEGGLERLEGDQARRFLDAFGDRREAGLSAGLDSGGLDAFAQAMGGWEAALEQVGAMSLEDAVNLIESILRSLKEESLADEKILKETNTKASKRARELIAKAMAMQAAREDRPRLLRSVLAQSQALLGMSSVAAANMRSEFAKVKVGAIVAPIQLKGDDMSLYEVAWLSQATGAQSELAKAGAKSSTKERQRALVSEVESQVRRQAMRSESGSQVSQVWRETLKEWKSGVLGEARLSELQKVVDKKLDTLRGSERQDPAAPEEGRGAKRKM